MTLKIYSFTDSFSFCKLFIPSTPVIMTSSPSSSLCLAFSSRDTVPYSEFEIFLMTQSYNSSPFLSNTSNCSPKSLKTLEKTPRQSEMMNFFLCFLQNYERVKLILKSFSVEMITS